MTMDNHHDHLDDHHGGDHKDDDHDDIHRWPSWWQLTITIIITMRMRAKSFLVTLNLEQQNCQWHWWYISNPYDRFKFSQLGPNNPLPDDPWPWTTRKLFGCRKASEVVLGTHTGLFIQVLVCFFLIFQCFALFCFGCLDGSCCSCCFI